MRIRLVEDEQSVPSVQQIHSVRIHTNYSLVNRVLAEGVNAQLTTSPIMQPLNNLRHLLHQKAPIGVHRAPRQHAHALVWYPFLDVFQDGAGDVLGGVRGGEACLGEACLQEGCELCGRGKGREGKEGKEKRRGTLPCWFVHHSSILEKEFQFNGESLGEHSIPTHRALPSRYLSQTGSPHRQVQGFHS